MSAEYRWLEWDELYDDVDPVPIVVEQMKKDGPAGPGMDLGPHEDSLRRLIEHARWTYLEEYSDWLRRAEPEGSPWRPSRRVGAEANLHRTTEPEARYDYGADANSGWETFNWSEWWNEHWSKPVSKTGRRARNPGRFRGDPPNVQPPLGKSPLVTTYHLVNRWWRTVLKDAFRPSFDRLESCDAKLPLRKMMPELNPAARLLILVMFEVDARCTLEHCRRVHEENSRDQDTSLE